MDIFYNSFVIIAVTAVITELTTREGYLSILTCVASGDPQPVVSWSEEGESNSSTLSSRHTVYTNGSLVISDTNRSDTGSYVCRGSNVGGEDQDTISLNASLFIIPHAIYCSINRIPSECNNRYKPRKGLSQPSNYTLP